MAKLKQEQRTQGDPDVLANALKGTTDEYETAVEETYNEKNFFETLRTLEDAVLEGKKGAVYLRNYRKKCLLHLIFNASSFEHTAHISYLILTDPLMVDELTFSTYAFQGQQKSEGTLNFYEFMAGQKNEFVFDGYMAVIPDFLSRKDKDGRPFLFNVISLANEKIFYRVMHFYPQEIIEYFYNPNYHWNGLSLCGYLNFIEADAKQGRINADLTKTLSYYCTSTGVAQPHLESLRRMHAHLQSPIDHYYTSLVFTYYEQANETNLRSIVYAVQLMAPWVDLRYIEDEKRCTLSAKTYDDTVDRRECVPIYEKYKPTQQTTDIHKQLSDMYKLILDSAIHEEQIKTKIIGFLSKYGELGKKELLDFKSPHEGNSFLHAAVNHNRVQLTDYLFHELVFNALQPNKYGIRAYECQNQATALLMPTVRMQKLYDSLVKRDRQKVETEGAQKYAEETRKCFDLLRKYDKYTVNAVIDQKGNTIMHLVARHGTEKELDGYLEVGGDPDKKNKNGQSPWQYTDNPRIARTQRTRDLLLENTIFDNILKKNDYKRFTALLTELGSDAGNTLKQLKRNNTPYLFMAATHCNPLFFKDSIKHCTTEEIILLRNGLDKDLMQVALLADRLEQATDLFIHGFNITDFARYQRAALSQDAKDFLKAIEDAFKTCREGGDENMRPADDILTGILQRFRKQQSTTLEQPSARSTAQGKTENSPTQTPQ